MPTGGRDGNLTGSIGKDLQQWMISGGRREIGGAAYVWRFDRRARLGYGENFHQ